MRKISNPDSLLRLNRAFELQISDPVYAFREFQALSDQGDPYAMLQLAWCYQKGIGTTRDTILSEKWYSHAIEIGPENVKKDARLYQAIALESIDSARAFAEVQSLSQEGHPASMVKLGRYYQDGIGIPADATLAEAWYRRAFETGSGRAKKRAIYYLGHLYLAQNDFDNAFKIFTEGAELNDPVAIYHLGRMYWLGTGIKSQPAEARLLFERASNLGHLLARRNLAILLMSGRFGVLNILKGLCMLPLALLKGVIVIYKSLGYKIKDERIM